MTNHIQIDDIVCFCKNGTFYIKKKGMCSFKRWIKEVQCSLKLVVLRMHTCGACVITITLPKHNPDTYLNLKNNTLLV